MFGIRFDKYFVYKKIISKNDIIRIDKIRITMI